MKKLRLNCPCCGSPFKYNDESNEYTCDYCGAKTIMNYNRDNVSNLSVALSELKDYFYNGNYYKALNMSTELLNIYPDNEEIKYINYKSSEMILLKYKKDEKDAVLKRTNYLLSLFKDPDKTKIDEYFKENSFDYNYSLVDTYYCTYPEEESISNLMKYMEEYKIDMEKRKKETMIQEANFFLAYIIIGIIIALIMYFKMVVK